MMFTPQFDYEYDCDGYKPNNVSTYKQFHNDILYKYIKILKHSLHLSFDIWPFSHINRDVQYLIQIYYNIYDNYIS